MIETPGRILVRPLTEPLTPLASHGSALSRSPIGNPPHSPISQHIVDTCLTASATTRERWYVSFLLIPAPWRLNANQWHKKCAGFLLSARRRRSQAKNRAAAGRLSGRAG